MWVNNFAEALVCVWIIGSGAPNGNLQRVRIYISSQFLNSDFLVCLCDLDGLINFLAHFTVDFLQDMVNNMAYLVVSN